MPTCRILWRDGPSVEHLPVPGDSPHLVGPSDGDGLEGLVGAHVEPGAALRTTVSVLDGIRVKLSSVILRAPLHWLGSVRYSLWVFTRHAARLEG